MKERQAEEQRRHEEEVLRRNQDELSVRMHHQEDDLRRRQKENSIFIQVRIILTASMATVFLLSHDENIGKRVNRCRFLDEDDRNDSYGFTSVHCTLLFPALP